MVLFLHYIPSDYSSHGYKDMNHKRGLMIATSVVPPPSFPSPPPPFYNNHYYHYRESRIMENLLPRLFGRGKSYRNAAADTCGGGSSSSLDDDDGPPPILSHLQWKPPSLLLSPTDTQGEE